MATETKTFDLSTISNEKGSATYGFTYSGGVLTPANKGNHNTYAYAKLTFEMPADGTLTLGVTQSSEKSYDFGLVSNLDSSLAQSTSVDSSVKYNAKGLDGSTTITYDNVTKGSHFITVKYKKDGSQSTGSDVFNITSLVATYEAAAEGVTTFDLSTLELAEGTYDITVVAKADGYKDSAESEAVSYEVAAAEDELQGTWVFNGNPTWSDDLKFKSFYFMLETDATNYRGIYFYGSSYLQFWVASGTANTVDAYSKSSGWIKDSYKTWVITSKLVEVENGSTLLTWLKANATKQEEEIKTDATVTITNTSTSHGANIGTSSSSFPVDSDIGTVDANSTKTFTIPKGTTIFISGNSGIMPYWESTSVTGDIVAENYIDGYIAPYTINGDGTIIGYAEDLD